MLAHMHSDTVQWPHDGNSPKGRQCGAWINKMWPVRAVKYHWAGRRKEAARTRRNLENTGLSAGSRTQHRAALCDSTSRETSRAREHADTDSGLLALRDEGAEE